VSVINTLHEPAIIVSIYGQRGKLQSLLDHLVAKRQMIPDNATTFSNENTKTLLLHFDPPTAADTTVVQLVLNDHGEPVDTWPRMREQIETLLADAQLQWPVWGYTLIYQAMLAQDNIPSASQNAAFDQVLHSVLSSIQCLHSPVPSSLPVLASSSMTGGRVYLLHIPLQHDGLEASTICVALSLSDPTNRLVREVLLGPGALLLMPDLIAHKSYHQIRQFRGNDWIDTYHSRVQLLHDTTTQLLSQPRVVGTASGLITVLTNTYDDMVGRSLKVQRLRVSLARQAENYGWWTEQENGNNSILHFHQRQLHMALRELELLGDEGRTVLEVVNTTIEVVRMRAERAQERHSQVLGIVLTVLGVVLAIPQLITWGVACGLLLRINLMDPGSTCTDIRSIRPLALQTGMIILALLLVLGAVKWVISRRSNI
jgi:hypothetical protein